MDLFYTGICAFIWSIAKAIGRRIVKDSQKCILTLWLQCDGDDDDDSDNNVKFYNRKFYLIHHIP